MTDALKATTTEEWRKPRVEGYLLPLLSGQVVRIRPVALDALMIRGEIPDTLTPLVTKMLYATEEEVESDEDNRTYEANVQNIRFINIIVKAALVEPKVCDDDCEDCDDCILVEDIEFDDRVQIQEACLLPAEAVRSFCEKQAAYVEALSNGEDVRPETE